MALATHRNKVDQFLSEGVSNKNNFYLSYLRKQHLSGQLKVCFSVEMAFNIGRSSFRRQGLYFLDMM